MKNAKISEVLKNYRKLNKLSVRDVSGILKEKSLNVAEKTIYGWKAVKLNLMLIPCLCYAKFIILKIF